MYFVTLFPYHFTYSSVHERNPLRHYYLKRIHNKMNDVINQGNKINLIISSGNQKKQVLQRDKRRNVKLHLKQDRQVQGYLSP